MLLPIALLVFMAALTLGGFWFEARKQEPMLRAIFAPDDGGP